MGYNLSLSDWVFAAKMDSWFSCHLLDAVAASMADSTEPSVFSPWLPLVPLLSNNVFGQEKVPVCLRLHTAQPSVARMSKGF